jgi:hypothetical protein
MIGIQTQLAERCLQLLALPEDSEVLPNYQNSFV